MGPGVLVLGQHREGLDLGQRHNYLVVDFADFDTFKVTVAEWFGKNRVDILINNTNGPSAGGVLDKTVDDYQRSFDLLFPVRLPRFRRIVLAHL